MTTDLVQAQFCNILLTVRHKAAATTPSELLGKTETIFKRSGSKSSFCNEICYQFNISLSTFWLNDVQGCSLVLSVVTVRHFIFISNW